MWGVMLQLASLCACVALAPNTGSPAKDGVPPKETADCYLPVEGGWQIRITGDPKAPRLKPGSAIGVAADDPRHASPPALSGGRPLVGLDEGRACQAATHSLSPLGPGGE